MLELRQYTLHPGRRDELIDLFDRHFVESQESVGMTIAGQFRDRRRPDRFVWVRGFRDMDTRRRALEQFYAGPVWAEHSRAANATMIDASDVRLLKPAGAGKALRLTTTARPRVGEQRADVGIVAGILPLAQPADTSAIAAFDARLAPALARLGVTIEGVFVTEPAANTFPRLPVREGNVLVWFGSAAGSPSGLADRLRDAGAALAPMLRGDPEILELEPTARSLLGHHRR